MKTKLLLAIMSIVTTTSFAGTVSQSLTFDDLGLGGGTASSGTYNPNDTFSFDVYLTFSGYNATGLSFWLETVTAFAGSLSITGVTYGTTFPDATSLDPNPAFFNAAGGASPGYMSENRNLGSTLDPQGPSAGPGTYFVAHVTLQISAAAPPGTYDLASTIVTPHTSVVTSFDGTTFADQNLPAAHYSVNIVPEPSTFTLIGLGAIAGLGLFARRCRRRKAAPWF